MSMEYRILDENDKVVADGFDDLGEIWEEANRLAQASKGRKFYPVASGKEITKLGVACIKEEK